MKKILALTAAAALAVTSIGCTKHEAGSEPAPPAAGTTPADKATPEGGTTPAPEGGAPAPTDAAPAAPEGKAP